MRLHFNWTLLALSLVATQQLYADVCKDEAFTDAILKQVRLNNTPGHLADCKLLPQQTDRAVLLYQQMLEGPDDEEQPVAYRIHLLTADTQRRLMLDHYIDADEYTTDAMVLSNMSLDTAAYQLQPQLRALGVRIDYQGSSRVSPYNYTLLNLYDLGRHKKLLNNLRVNLDHGENDGRCNAEYYRRNGTVVILNTQHNAMADLRINSKEAKQQDRQIKDDCKQIKYSEKKCSHILKFNGKTYDIPRYLQEYGE